MSIWQTMGTMDLSPTKDFTCVKLVSQVDATIEMVQSMVEVNKGGKLEILASYTNKPIEGLDIKPMGELYNGASEILAYIFGILGSNLMLKALKMPKWYLIPFITILCIIGSYALQNNISDVIFMIIFGIIGYVFERSGYPVGPIVLGIILGPMIETNFRQAFINTGSVQSLILSFITRPISLIILILIIGSFIFQTHTMRKFEAGTNAPSKP